MTRMMPLAMIAVLLLGGCGKCEKKEKAKGKKELVQKIARHQADEGDFGSLTEEEEQQLALLDEQITQEIESLNLAELYQDEDDDTAEDVMAQNEELNDTIEVEQTEQNSAVNNNSNEEIAVS